MKYTLSASSMNMLLFHEHVVNCAIDRRKYKEHHSDDVKYNIMCVQSLSLPQNSYQAIVVPILMSIKVHFRSLFTFSQSSSISICCNLSSSMLIFLLSCFVRRLWSLLSCSLSALTYDEIWQRLYPFTLKWSNLLVQGIALYTGPQPDLYSDKYSIIMDAFSDDIL